MNCSVFTIRYVLFSFSHELLYPLWSTQYILRNVPTLLCIIQHVLWIKDVKVYYMVVIIIIMQYVTSHTWTRSVYSFHTLTTSVPFSLVTTYCSGVSFFCQSIDSSYRVNDKSSANTNAAHQEFNFLKHYKDDKQHKDI